MNRQQKEALVSELNGKFKDSNAVFLVNFRGLSVDQMQALRSNLRQSSATLKVAKARLMKLATENVDGGESFKEALKEQVGLVFAEKEVPAVAKAMVEFSKKNDALSVVAGLFEAKCLTQDQIKRLALLPSREVLLAQLAGTLQAPIAGFAQVLQLLLVKLACALKEVEKQKQQAS